MEFWKAGNEIEDLAKDLIANYHSEIATATISFVYKDKPSSTELSTGQVVVAKKVSGLWYTLTGETDFVIVITYELFNELSPAEQQAMLDMALEACTTKKGEDGEEKLTDAGDPIFIIRPYDIQGFSSVIARHGLDIFTKIGECIREANKSKDETGVSDGPSAGETTKVRKSDKGN